MSNSLPGLDFPSVRQHKISAIFDGGDVSSDAGVMLVSQADLTLGLTSSLAAAVSDTRQASKVRYDLQRIISARVYGIACGYEDANDHDTLRNDPLFKLACDRLPLDREVLASQPTISRAENAVSAKDLVRMATVLARRVIEQLPAESSELYLDVDATDDPCHGQQEFEFYNGHYGNHCFLPLHLHITGSDRRQWLLASLLRPGKASYRDGLFSLLRRAIRLIRERFPKTRIVLRADAGFGYYDTLAFCEKYGVEYLLGLQTNRKLTRLSERVQATLRLRHETAGDGGREYGQFEYKAKTWPQMRKVVAKSEFTLGKLNTRYVVTSLDGAPEQLYLLYCERGDRENRIKELKLDLYSGRTSCHRFTANSLRLLLHNAASVLLTVVQAAAKGTEYARAQVSTLRVRLFKVAARVIQTCRRVCVHLPTSYPEKAVWFHLNRNLSQLVT